MKFGPIKNLSTLIGVYLNG